jgi:hypothetical protein
MAMAINGNHRPSCAHAELEHLQQLRRNPSQSFAIIRNQLQSIAIHRNPSQSIAISGHHLQQLGRVETSGLCEAEALAVRSHHRAHDL